MSNDNAMSHDTVTITQLDRCRLGNLLAAPGIASLGSKRARFCLEIKLEEANSIPSELTPPDLVTMNSTVVLLDIDAGERIQCTLVYPSDRDLSPHSVGVLEELGRQILGRTVGDVIELSGEQAPCRILIESLVYQPEAAGVLKL